MLRGLLGSNSDQRPYKSPSGRYFVQMLETISRVCVIVAALVCGTAVVKNQFLASSEGNARPMNKGRDLVGKAILTAPHPEVAIVAVVSSQCKFCAMSQPFYQKLASWRRGGAAFSFVAMGVEWVGMLDEQGQLEVAKLLNHVCATCKVRI